MSFKANDVTLMGMDLSREDSRTVLTAYFAYVDSEGNVHGEVQHQWAATSAPDPIRESLKELAAKLEEHARATHFEDADEHASSGQKQSVTFDGGIAEQLRDHSTERVDQDG